jgi:AraC-like DNA-binding protein
MDISNDYLAEFARGRFFYQRALNGSALLKEQKNNRNHHFIYFRSDDCTVKFDDGTEKHPSEGSVCYIAPGIAYEITTPDSLNYISGVICYGMMADIFASSCAAFRTHISLRPEVIDAFNDVIDIMDELDTKLEDTNRIASAFYKLFIELVFAPIHTVETKSSIIAQKIKQYIETNIDSDISVTSIAKQFYLSETHVIRIFREKFGVTPKQYILKAKIDASKILLLDTSLQIKEIAMTYHFADSYHFSHTFKRFMGVSPEKFRLRDDQHKLN